MSPIGGRRIVPAAGLLLAALLASTARADPDATNRPDCGKNDDPLPDFTLTDVNPTSASYGQEIALTDLQGQVVFIMFIHSSCGVCQSRSQYLQTIWNEHEASWSGRVALLLVNMIGWESEIDAFCSLHDLPVLQDTEEENAQEKLGADIYYSYLIDGDRGYVSLYYNTSLPTDEQRLIDEIEGALGARR